MSSSVLVYILIAVAWIAFGVLVVIVQGHAQEQLEEPRVDGPDEPADPAALEAVA